MIFSFSTASLIWCFPGNPKSRKPETGIRNQKPESGIGTGNQKPESGIRNPQIKENKFYMFAKIIQWKLLSVKNKRPSKKSLKLNLFWNKNFSSVKIRTSVILSEVYDYGNLNKVRHNVIPSTLRAAKIIIALTRNNRCTNFNRQKFLFQKRLSLRVFLFGLLLPNILWFLYFLSR